MGGKIKTVDVMDFLNIGSQTKKFESLFDKVLKKLDQMEVKLTATNKKLDDVERKIMKLGHACGTAFEQTKVVINALKEHTESIGESLDEYGGVIEASTFDW